MILNIVRWYYYLLVIIASYFVPMFRALFRSCDDTWCSMISTKTEPLAVPIFRHKVDQDVHLAVWLQMHMSVQCIKHGGKLNFKRKNAFHKFISSVSDHIFFLERTCSCVNVLDKKGVGLIVYPLRAGKNTEYKKTNEAPFAL